MVTIATLKNDFNSIDKLRMFEIEVINIESKEKDYIVFHIELIKNTLFAFHVPLTKKQQKSKKIAFQKIVLDSCFSIDELINDLYQNCIEAIINSEFFELGE